MIVLRKDVTLDAECVALAEAILELRESVAPELLAKQLRLLKMLVDDRRPPYATAYLGPDSCA